jgi:hypothetical protein
MRGRQIKSVQKPKLTEQKQSFHWNTDVENAFQTLKEALCSAPILAYPQPGQLTVYVWASDQAVSVKEPVKFYS